MTTPPNSPKQSIDDYVLLDEYMIESVQKYTEQSYIMIDDLYDIKKLSFEQTSPYNKHSLVFDMRWLCELNMLEHLDLRYVGKVDLAYLQYIPSLRSLVLPHAHLIENWRYISRCRNLNRLLITHNHGVDLTPLRYIPNLRELSLNICSNTSLLPLYLMPSLTHLGIDSSHNIDYSPIYGLYNLRSFSCFWSCEFDVRYLENSKKLAEIDLSFTTVKNSELLRKFKRLNSIIGLKSHVSHVSHVSHYVSNESLFSGEIDIV
jgi:hypothetical protein